MFFVLQLIIYTVLTIISFVVAGGIAGLSSMGNGGAGAAGAGVMGMVATLGIFALFFGLVVLVFFVPNLAVSARRLHDQDRSGWWQLIYWVPWLIGIAISVINLGSQSTGLAGIGLIMSGLQLVGLIVLIVFYCLPGTPGPNQYGPDPLAAERNAAVRTY